MNGEYLRGEVYWVCLDDSVGEEEKTGRPALIVSSNGLNEKQNTVTVAFITTSGFAAATRPSIEGPGGLKRRVICDQLRTIDKSRLVKYDSTVTGPELIRVSGALASALSLPNTPPAAKPATGNTKEDDLLALQVELTTLRKMYDKVVDQLVEMRVAADIARKTESALVVEESPKLLELPKHAPVTEPDPEPESALVDINRCDMQGLLGIGFTVKVANAIIDCRPYLTIEDLRAVPGVVSAAYQLVKNKVTVGDTAEYKKPKKPVVKVEKPPVKLETPPVSVEKVNVNTASAKEIHDVSGLHMTACYAITGKRNRDGLFKSLDELLIPGRISAVLLDKYRDKLTVGNVSESAGEQPTKKK